MRRLGVFVLGVLALVPALTFTHSDGRWVRKEVSGPAPDFTLTDQDEQKVSLRDLRGKVILLNFVFTYCPAGCPLTTSKFRQIQEALEGKPVHLVSISIDPDHDTPAALKEYGEKRRADFRAWSFLTGTMLELDRVRIHFGVTRERRGLRGPNGDIVKIAIVDHALKTFLVDKKGMKRFEYWGQDFETEAVIEDLTRVLAED